MTPFLKMHGLGNDFVVFDARDRPMSFNSEQVRAIANRRLGVGCDQVIVIGKSADADAHMRIYNADGGEVESCGNAARCVAQLLFNESGRNAIRLDTAGGLLVCRAAGEQVTVDMGAPRFDWRDVPLADARNTNAFELDVQGFDLHALKEASAVSVGNPHCVLFVENVEDAPAASLGSALEHHPLFPERTNVEFVQVLAPDHLRMRVWERGAGITRACGTGACASMAAAQRRGLCGTKVEVVLDGGSLTVEWPGGESHILMTGPSALSFRGEVDLDSLP